MSRGLISYADFDASRVIGEKVVAKDIKENGVPSGDKYYEFLLKYNVGTPDKPVYKSFIMEGPEMDVGGITTRTKNGKTSYSVFAKFPLDNPEAQLYVQKVKEAYTRVAEILNAIKGAVKLVHFTMANPQSLLEHPIWEPRDEISGEPDKTKAPSQWLKLQHYVWDGKLIKTTFLQVPTEENPKPEPIDWNLLTDVSMKIVPAINWHHVYVGPKAIIQAKMSSAIVLDIKPRDNESRQVQTINRLVQAGPGIGNRLADQIARLTMARHDAMSMVGGHAGSDLVNPVATDDKMSSANQQTGFASQASSGSSQYEQNQGMNSQFQQPIYHSNSFAQQQSVPQQMPQQIPQQAPQQLQVQQIPQQQQSPPRFETPSVGPTTPGGMQVEGSYQTAVQQIPLTVPQFPSGLVQSVPNFPSGSSPVSQSTPVNVGGIQLPGSVGLATPGSFSQFMNPQFQVLPQSLPAQSM